MKQKLLFLWALILPSTGFTFAQTETASYFSVGVVGGYVHNSLTTSTGYRAFTKYGARESFALGIVGRYTFNNWLAVQAEPSLIQKNFSWERTEGSKYPDFYENRTNNYLQLPVMAHFLFGGQQLKGFLNLGGFAGYQVSAHREGVTHDRATNLYSYDEPFEFDSTRDNRLEYGLLAGIGLEYDTNGFTFFAEGRYEYGLSDLQKKYMIQQIPRYNNTSVIQAGVMYNF
ncbi:hypothetical protein FACS1894162_9030 [Bacteroidia bacterium]|nr:hypothetical protein FACS1894162_9030 [Bacteroidia bacterium]